MEDPEDLNHTYSADQVQRLLQCPVCLDRFRQPKLLPCQHTFCMSPCLEGLVNRLTRLLRCPECRAEHRVPYQGVDTYPNNLTIMSFLELPTRPLPDRVYGDIGGGDVLGGGAGGSGNVDRNGGNIKEAEGGFSAGFQVQPPRPAAVVAASVSRPVRTGCASCRREVPLARCLHCDGVLCEPCGVAHMEGVKSDIDRLVSQLRRGLPLISHAISNVERKTEQLHQRAEAAKSCITETIERYIMEMRGRQRLLHSEVETFLFGEVRSLRMHQENVEVELASMASFCDSTEATLSRSNHRIPDQDLVDVKRQCQEQMEKLTHYENGSARLPNERYLQFDIEGNRLSNVISNFGEIVVADEAQSDTRSNSPDSSSPPPPSPQAETPGSASTHSSPAGAEAAMPTSDELSTSPAERARAFLRDLDAGYYRPRAPSPPTQSSNETFDLGSDNGSEDNGSGDTLFVPEERAITFPRRTLQERRRHHLSDTQLATLMQSDQSPFAANPRPRRGNYGRSATTDAVTSVANASAGVRGGTSRSRSIGPGSRTGNSLRPPLDQSPRTSPLLSRNRSYTRDVPETIREERSSHTATGDADYRPRSPAVRFDLPPSRERSSESPDDVNLNSYQSDSFESTESTIVSVAMNNYQNKGQALLRFGHRGDMSGEFSWPRGVAVSPRDNMIYIADSSNHRIQVFDDCGHFVKEFGSYGEGEQQFDSLAGLAVNNFGQIIIADRYNHRIQVFDHHGSFRLEFGEDGTGDGQMLYPCGVTCDNMGFIYVCDKENHRIQVFQANGCFVRKFGRLGQSIGQFENPHYLAIGPDNKVFVSDGSNHRIQVFSMYGDFLYTFGSLGSAQGQLKYPKGIAVDEQGFVIVADSGNNRIQVFRADGRFYCMFGSYGNDGGQFKGVEGVAILSSGNIVVGDRENHRVQIF